MDENNADVKLALEEMRFNMEQSLNAGDALDQKVNVLLAAAGLLLAIATTLQVSLVANRSNLYWFLLLLAIGLYAICVGVALFGSSPRSYHLALSADWSELDAHIFGRIERDAILSLLAGYVDQIQYNERVNKRKAGLYFLSLCILGITTVIVVCLAFIA
jgi:hypothetical protein